MTDTNIVADANDLDAYRVRAREWLAANMAPVDPSKAVTMVRGLGHRTAESFLPERALQKKLYEAGYAGITVPQEYGGQGLTPAHQRAFLDEAMSYRMPDLGIAGGTTFGVILNTMLVHASPELLKRHVPSMLSGDKLWVQFFSEPGAGSDLAGVITRAERDGDRWILNGSKVWSSGAYYADYGMCLARTNWDVPKHRGLTWFVVRCDLPGVVVEPIREINGDAEFCQEFFTDVELTDDDVIGEVNQGWNVSRTMLVFERGGGEVQGAARPRPGRVGRDLAPDLVKLAARAGRSKDPEARQLVARAHTNDWVIQQLGARIAKQATSGAKNAAGYAAYGKLAAGTYSAIRARIGLELGRAPALTWEPGDESQMTTALNYLNGRVMAIAGGTNEMQRNAVGEQVLDLPREPSFDSDRPFRDVVRSAKEWTGKTQ